MLMLGPAPGCGKTLTKHGHLRSCDSAAADTLIQCVPDWASSNNSNLSRLLPAGCMHCSACTTGFNSSACSASHHGVMPGRRLCLTLWSTRGKQTQAFCMHFKGFTLTLSVL